MPSHDILAVAVAAGVVIAQLASAAVNVMVARRVGREAQERIRALEDTIEHLQATLLKAHRVAALIAKAAAAKIAEDRSEA